MGRRDRSRPGSATGKRVAAAPISDVREPARNVPPLALGLIAAISVLWGLNWPVMKLAVGELSPWTFRVICVLVSGVGLLLVAWVSGDRLTLPRRYWPSLLFVAIFNVTGWNLLSAASLVHMGGGHGAIVAYTMPVWAMLFGVLWLGERLETKRLLALALGMLAVGCLIGPDLVAFGQSPLGPLLMLGAAMCWAMGIVALKRHPWPIGIVALSAWQMIVGSIPIVLLWLVIEPRPDLSRLTWVGMLATGYASTVALIFCFAAYNKVVTMLPAAVAAISTLVIPVVGLLSSAWLLDEPAVWREFGAMLLVAAAIGLILLPRRAAN